MDNVRPFPRDTPADHDAYTRQPPHDLAAEQSVLGGMLLSRDAITHVARALAPSDFYKPAHETIYRTICDLNAAGDPVDPITVTAELTSRQQIDRVGGPAYLHSLVQAVPTAANAEYYAGIVHDRAVRRRMVEAGTRIAQMGYAADADVDELTTAARKEVEEATAARRAGEPGHLTSALIDWNPFFTTDFGRVQLLPGRLMAPGQQITVVGDGKAGKSLFVQEWAWRMATGQSFLGDRPQAPVSILYLDAENGQEDIQERFLSFGAGPGRMGLLSYASFPPVRPLDTAGGGADVLALAEAVEAQLVIIDTVSRFISGPENDADTWLSLYRHTLLPLKRAGLGSIRLDHLGKDGERGARGSSAKTQDVDHVWTLTAQGGGSLMLKRTHTRTGIGPDSFPLVRKARRDGDRYAPGGTQHVLMTYETGAEAMPGTVEHIVATLDRDGVPNDWGAPRCTKRLAELGVKAAKSKIEEAVRTRKTRTSPDLPPHLPYSPVTETPPETRGGR